MLIRVYLQKDICLLHEIEDVVGKQLAAYECDDREVTKDITKVWNLIMLYVAYVCFASEQRLPKLLLSCHFYEH
jgi:hypothetical protein